jgi:hypothetical protein
LTPLEFLTAVWADEGLYCIGTPIPNRGGALNHYVFTSIEHAARTVEKLKDTENVFYATHTLKEEKAYDKTDKRFRVRTQSNMRMGKEFFFELDCDHGTIGYESQAEALAALLDFCRTTMLPKPMVVSSGGGLHVHWILDRPLQSNTEWATIAARLKQLAKHHGFKIDPSRTTDTASVLRVAGTFNLKKDTRREVTALTSWRAINPDTFAELIEDALVVAGQTPEATRTEGDDFGNNTAIDFSALKPPPLDTVYEVCPQMRRLRDMDANFMGEPEWYALAGVFAFTEGGVAEFHRISKEHPNYDFDGAQGKIERWNAGPTSCAKLASASGSNESICLGCKFVTKQQGPVTFARNRAPSAAPVVLHLLADNTTAEIELTKAPAPYRCTPEKGIQARAETEDGKEFLGDVYPYQLYPIERTFNKVHETEHQFWRVHTPNDGVREFSLDAAVLVDDRLLKTRLANVGVHAEHFNQVRDYMGAYIRELQRSVAMKSQHNHLGWIDDYTRFVVPGKTYEPDGSITPTTLGAMAHEASTYITKKGSMEEQIRLMEFLNRPEFVAHQYFITNSLASVLIHASGAAKNGMTVNMQGDTGGIKSTALYVAAGFWGPPREYTLDGVTGKVTAKFAGTRMQMLQNLPFIMDEITLMEAEEARKLAFAATQAQTVTHGNMPNGLPRKDPIGGIHAALSITTSNVSLVSLVCENNPAGKAVAARILELWVPTQSLYKKGEVDQFLRALDQHYGHIGEAFIRFYVANKEAVDALVVECSNQIETQFKITPEDRFRVDNAAYVLVTGKIANHLGLLPFDYSFIRRWVMGEMLLDQRTKVDDEHASSTPLVMLTDYLELIHSDILRVTHMGSNIPSSSSPRSLKGHYDVDHQRLHILKEGFKEYCQRRNKHALPIIRELVKMGIVLQPNERYILGVGTEYAKGRSACVLIDMDHPEIAATPLVVQAPPPAGSNIVPIGKRKDKNNGGTSQTPGSQPSSSGEE